MSGFLPPIHQNPYIYYGESSAEIGETEVGAPYPYAYNGESTSETGMMELEGGIELPAYPHEEMTISLAQNPPPGADPATWSENIHQMSLMLTQNGLTWSDLIHQTEGFINFLNSINDDSGEIQNFLNLFLQS